MEHTDVLPIKFERHVGFELNWVQIKSNINISLVLRVSYLDTINILNSILCVLFIFSCDVGMLFCLLQTSLFAICLIGC